MCVKFRIRTEPAWVLQPKSFHYEMRSVPERGTHIDRTMMAMILFLLFEFENIAVEVKFNLQYCTLSGYSQFVHSKPY